MSKKDLIVMLTWHDVTVKNAKEIFLEAKDANASHWGFKIEGTTPESMAELLQLMKQAGKRTYIEVLATDEATCLEAAKLCVQCGADHLLGTIYYENVHKICQNAGIAYSPFIGLDADTRLRAPIADVVRDAQKTETIGVSSITVSAYRYLGGEPFDLLQNVSVAVSRPFYVLGSVDNYAKLDQLKALPMLQGFSIGGAFFEQKFGKTFSEQINVLSDYLAR